MTRFISIFSKFVGLPSYKNEFGRTLSKMKMNLLSNVKVPAFEPLARGRVEKIILSQSSQT